MKEILLQLARYHQWSGRTLFARLSGLPDEVLSKDTGSSFGSINKTLFHLLAAEQTWWQRIHLLEPVNQPDADLAEDTHAMIAGLNKMSAQWITLIQHAADNRLTHVFAYKNSKKAFFKQPLYEALIHLFHQQSYHFGQIITMLRQQGIEPLPATDFIDFARKKKK